MITLEHDFFYLETAHTSYVIRLLGEGMLQHVYYGGKISRDAPVYYNFFQNRSFGPVVRPEDRPISLETIPQEYPSFGRGDFRCPAFVVETAKGRRVSQLWYRDFRIREGRPALAGLPYLDTGLEAVQTLELILEDLFSGVKVRLFYSVFEEEDIISRYVVLENTSGQPVQIRNAASLSVDLGRADFDFLSLEGAWARERHISRRALAPGVTAIGSRRGSSGHPLNPFAALLAPGAGEGLGEVYGFAFVYSGDFRILAEVDPYGSTRLQVGINPETFSWKLEEGQSFTTPEALMTYSSRGLNGMSHNFHQACRRHLGKCADPSIRHPILINSWEAMYFSITEEKLRQFILDCKGLGIDTFVLDDGWFGHRDGDASSLGDWFVDRRKFPEGLSGVVDFCHENGMRFGIWFEPEMISRDSLLYETHPDWCIHCEELPPVESRNQLVLDMSRPEVVEEIYRQMAAVIREYDVSYIKWDFNRNLTDNGSSVLSADCQGEHTHRYVLGVYDLMQRLNDSFPEVFFEGCSGGGGRFDFGILYYMPQIWTSDDTDAVERIKIQYGTSLVYPPETMAAHVSACPNHQTGRVTSFETRGEVAQMCSFGYEFDVGSLTEEEKEQIRRQVQRHRRLEPLIEKGDFYRLCSPFDSNLCVWQLVSPDRGSACVWAAFLTTEPNPNGRYVRLQGLDPKKRYRIIPGNVPAGCGSFWDRLLRGEICREVAAGGDTLMHAGLPLLQPAGWDHKVLVFDLQEVCDET